APGLSILLSQTKCQNYRKTKRIARCAVNSLQGRRSGKNPRLEVVLSFVKNLIRQVINIEVQVDPGPNGFCNGEIKDVETGRADGCILTVEPVISNVPVVEGGVGVSPAGHRQRSVRHRVRGTVHVDPGEKTAIEGIRDLRQSAV